LKEMHEISHRPYESIEFTVSPCKTCGKPVFSPFVMARELVNWPSTRIRTAHSFKPKKTVEISRTSNR
jgi:hypothetical protein